MRYEPIQLVFAFSNTKKVELSVEEIHFRTDMEGFCGRASSGRRRREPKFTFDGDRLKLAKIRRDVNVDDERRRRSPVNLD